MEEKDRLLSLAEAASALDVSQRTLTRLIDAGEIKGFMVGKRWKIQRSEVVDYILRQQKKNPNYIAQQQEMLQKEVEALKNRILDLYAQTAPENKQKFIDRFFEELSKSPAGQQTIDELSAEREKAKTWKQNASAHSMSTSI